MNESQFKTLRELSHNGRLSQRDLAGRIGLSLGRINYIVHSLIEKGYIKAKRFRNARNKMAYMYVMTPRGLQEKVRVTRAFLGDKMKEYEELQREIEDLRGEVQHLSSHEARETKEPFPEAPGASSLRRTNGPV